MEKKKNSPWKSILFYGLIIVIAVVLIYWVVAANDRKRQVTYTQFEDMVATGQVAEIDVYGYTVRIRTVNGVAEEKFPNTVDKYCTITNDCNVHEVIEEWNNKISERNDDGERVLKPGYEDKVIIEENYSYETESFISRVMPYLSIAVVIIIGIMLFKSLSSGGKQGFGFAKNKAKLVVSSNVRFTDVAGAEEEKEELKEIVEFLKTPSRFTELGARIPKGVLLVGPPGTGKTLLAKAVAGESKVPFFSISGSDFVELYVGVGASRVRDLFESAKASAPCIVFIDEIDAVGRQRGAGLGGGNDEREQTLNQLLVEMDGFETNSGIIVLAATNRSDVLDPALTRPGRFDRQIYVHLPDVKGREEIIKVHSRNKPLSDDVDFKRIARLTSGLAGADIENMLNEAALLAARDGRYKITMVDIQEGLNKAIMGPKKVSMVVTEEDKKITAVHEAGHAIVAESLPGCDKVQEISVIPRGGAGGYTLTFDEKDRTHMPKQKLLDTLAMMLGGRTAEEVMLNDVTTGASNDIDRATKLAHKMVAEWGMSEKLGLLSVGEGEEVFVGRNYQRSIAYSQQLAYEIDEEVKKLINEAHKTATKILTEKKDVIERIQQILLDKETIYKEEFEMLFNGASVEEVEKAIDKKEKEKKAYQEKAKKQAAEERFIKEIKNRVVTAEALAKAGVISAQDLNKIKNEAEAQIAKRTVKKEEPFEEKVETKKATKKTTRKSTSTKKSSSKSKKDNKESK